MDDKKLEIIQQLMDELQEEMHPSGDELGERLGRPKVHVMEMQAGAGEPDGDDGMGMQSKMGDKMDDGDMEPDADDMDSPDDMLKRRLMKMRG